jgi:hypothetical protein
MPPFTGILDALRASGFRDLNGSRVATTLSIGEPLLNAFIAAALPAGGAVRAVSVHPHAADRIGVRAKLSRPEFLPPINATVVIERQPQLPRDPTLAFRITGLAGLLALAGPVLSLVPKMPGGFRLDGDLLTIDLRELLAERRQEDLLGLAQRIVVHSEEGRIRLELDANVSSA